MAWICDIEYMETQNNTKYAFSRVILSYLVAAYSKDDVLYPRDIRMRAIVDQRLQFDLSTLAARTGDYFVCTY